jgi:hypothetical protein
VLPAEGRTGYRNNRAGPRPRHREPAPVHGRRRFRRRYQGVRSGSSAALVHRL